MKLQLVAKEVFSVYAVETSGGETDCAYFLSDDWVPQNKEESTERNRIFRIIQQACKNPRILSEPCHTIAEGVWQFKVRGGSYRIPWFYDENKIIICTHYFVKKGQKTPKAEKEKALKIKKEYFLQKASCNLNWKG